MTWNEAWELDPDAAASRLSERYRSGPESLALWAAFTVEGLHYLASVDAALERPPPPEGHRVASAHHRTDALQLAHARWATGDAVTAIDLCAAALGRMHRGYPTNRREMDFHDARNDRTLLSVPGPAAWIETVCADPDYEDLWPLREQLVHRFAPRHISLGLPGGSVSWSLNRESGGLIAIEDLVPLCRDVASRHVRAFLEAVEQL